MALQHTGLFSHITNSNYNKYFKPSETQIQIGGGNLKPLLITKYSKFGMTKYHKFEKIWIWCIFLAEKFANS